MSFASYLYNGSAGPNSQYCRQHYPKGEVKSIATTNKYFGKLGAATEIENTREEVVIDGAVKVTSVAQKVRENAAAFWKKAKSGSFISFTAVLITGVLAGGAAIAIGVALPELWIVAASVGGVALPMLALSIFLLTRAVQAGKKLKEWNDDPVANAQKDRIRIGKEGFYLAYSENLKGKIVSEEEIQALWYRDMDQYVDRFNEGESYHDSRKVSMVREFMTKSPLATAALNYTFGEVDQSIEIVNEKFESLKNNADVIRRDSQVLKGKIQAKKNQEMAKNDRRRNELLRPYELMVKPRRVLLEDRIFSLRTNLPSQRSELNQLSSRGVLVGRRVDVRHGRHLPSRQTVVHTVSPAAISQLSTNIRSQESELRRLENELVRVNTIYLAMTLPIKNMHAQNELKIKGWARREIQKVDIDEDKLMKKFFVPIQELLKEYASRNSEKPVEAEGLSEPVEVVDLNTPPMETKYEPVKYDNAWQEVIDQLEWEKKQAELEGDQLRPSKIKNV